MSNFVEMPHSYFEWRLSQGFDEGAIPLLYMQKDSRNLDELQVFLDSQEIINKPVFDINLAVKYVNIVGRKIKSRGSKELIEFMILATSTVEEFRGAFELALIGRYEASLILMRSSFEGFLRMMFNAIKAKEVFFQKTLMKREWPTKLGNKEIHWEDALNVNKALSLFEMCIISDKLNLSHPIKPLYDYLDIKTLNNHTHKNILQILESDTFILNQTTRKFDKEKLDIVSQYYQKYTEIWMIFMQNSADVLQPVFEPLVAPSKELETTFPNYVNLAYDRMYQNPDERK